MLAFDHKVSLSGSASQVLLVQVAVALNLLLNLIINSWIKLYFNTHMCCYLHMYLPKVTSKTDQLIQIYLISLTTANPYDAIIIFFKTLSLIS